MTSLKVLLYFLWTYLASLIMPVAHFIAFTFVLVMADLFTGTKAARHRGETIHSKGLGRSVLKIALYCVAILLSQGMDKVFFEPKNLSFDLVWMVSGIISLTEFKSNLENIATVTGIDVWAQIADLFPRLPKLPKKPDEPGATA